LVTRSQIKDFSYEKQDTHFRICISSSIVMIDKSTLRVYCIRLLAKGFGLDFKVFTPTNVTPSASPFLRRKNLRKRKPATNDLSEVIRLLREEYYKEEEQDIRYEYEGTVDEEIGFEFLAELKKKKVIPSKLAFLMNTTHPFHILLPSPWPFGAAAAAFIVASGAVMYMHSHLRGWYTLKLGVYGIIFVMYLWWRDVIREAKCEKRHNPRVKSGLTLGVVLFITSEAMFFFTFFWTFFYFSCMPSFDPEHTWPPKAVQESRHLGMATFNTLVLLSSAATVTWAHYSVMKGDKKHTVEALGSTIFLACLFMCIQLYEYRTYPFCMSDGIYGSCFYILTGFHGFHVFLGTIGLMVALRRVIHNSFTLSTHLGFEAAIWYWHFVDVVWLVVYLAVYWWGNS
jgi:cytochrome c oxidase subunit III